jgi:drug/metabolite transporter (DMT)-like permease
MPDSHSSETRKLKVLSEGVKFMALSTFAFSLANVCVKQIPHIPAMETVFFRCFFGTAFCFYGLKKAGVDWHGTNRVLLFARGVFGTAALYLFFLTLQNMPLASAMTIQYLSPIFTTFVAIFLLKEKATAIEWLFYAVAFSGVFFIQKFDTRISPLYLILGIFSAFCSAVAYNLVRKLRQQEHPLTVVLHFQLVGMIVGAIFTIFQWKMPTVLDLAYLFLIGVFSQLGQIYLTKALQREKAASVAIINYTGLIYGLGFGWILFEESQSVGAIFGMFLVVAGVTASVLYGRKQKQLAAIESTAG